MTAPPTPADELRRLVDTWRGRKAAALSSFTTITLDTCADELEPIAAALLSEREAMEGQLGEMLRAFENAKEVAALMEARATRAEGALRRVRGVKRHIVRAGESTFGNGYQCIKMQPSAVGEFMFAADVLAALAGQVPQGEPVAVVDEMRLAPGLLCIEFLPGGEKRVRAGTKLYAPTEQESAR